jgi:hypothetical protein
LLNSSIGFKKSSVLLLLPINIFHSMLVNDWLKTTNSWRIFMDGACFIETMSSTDYVKLPDGRKPFLDEMPQEYTLGTQEYTLGGDQEYTIDRDGRKSLVPKAPEEVGFVTSVINLCAAILGAGMLGLPYGFAQSGWALALGLLALSGFLSSFTMHLLSSIR